MRCEERRQMMGRRIFITVSGAFALCLGVLICSETVTAQRESDRAEGARASRNRGRPDYFPYPPGIVPPDVIPEVERVRREVRFIYKQAVAEWHALGPITP